MSRPSENDQRQQMVKSSRTLWGSRVQKTFCVPHFLIIRNRHNSASIIGGAMLNKSLIKFSVDGQGCIPSLLFDLRPNYGGGNADNGDLLQKVPCTATLRAPNLQQATANPRLRGRLLDTPGQVSVSLLWGLCSFLLGSGAHKVLFVPSKSLFPQFCVSSDSSIVGLMVTFSKRAYGIPRSAARIAPALVAGHC